MNKWLKGTLWTVGVLAVMVGVARGLFLRAWKVPDDPWLAASVAPTLAPGDQILLLTQGVPQFGELVRCSDPVEGARFVVGRIIGVGGDQLVVEGDGFRNNGTSYSQGAACDRAEVKVIHPVSKNDLSLQCGVVNLAGGWHYVASMPGARQRDTQTIKVAPGHYYLLSDNRSVHDDSRDFGQVPAELCKNRPIFRLWGAGGWTDTVARMTFLR